MPFRRGYKRRRYATRRTYGRRRRYATSGRFKRRVFKRRRFTRGKSRVGYARTSTRRAPGYRRWQGGVRRVRGSTRRIAIAAFKRSVPDLHIVENIHHDGTATGTSVFSNAFGNPGQTGTSGSTEFKITQTIAEGTGQDERIGDAIACKYLQITLTLGLDNGGTPWPSNSIAFPSNGTAPFTLVVWLQKNDDELVGRAEMWNTLDSGNMPQHWVYNKLRETYGTIVYQKQVWPKMRDQGIFWDSQSNVAVHRAIINEQTWRFRIKLPSVQTTWTAAGVADRNHYSMYLIRNNNTGTPYTSLYAGLTSKVYFAP